MSDIIAYKLNGEIYDTQSIGERESEAQPIYFDNSEDALKILRHSCAHLLAQAVRELYPSAKFFAKMAARSSVKRIWGRSKKRCARLPRQI